MAEEAQNKVKRDKIPRVSMPEQEPAVRARNFLEVPTGYTPEMAMQEAQRCIQCKKPGCVDGCPVEIDIPGFIRLIKEGDFTEGHPAHMAEKQPAGGLRAGLSAGNSM